MVNQLLFPASSEFTALCRTQVNQLQEGLDADRSAVYLMKELASGTRQLIPIVVYPENSNFTEEDGEEEGIIIPSDMSDSLFNYPSFQLPETATSSDLSSPSIPCSDHSNLDRFSQTDQHQIVFPLLHEHQMMGLLIVARQHGKWSEWEFTQIQRTAVTITLACVLDQRQGLWQERFRHQQWKQQAQQDHLNDILHQLRNPLMALKTFGKLLLKRLKPDIDRKNISLTQNLLRESDRLQQLLQDFGDYLNKIEDERDNNLTLETETAALTEDKTSFKSLPPSESLALESVQLNSILSPLLESTQAISLEKNIKLITQIPDALTPVKANGKALAEVLNNLLDNAIKYTPENGKIEVIITSEKPNWKGIIIRDDGGIIPPEDQPKIFERHYRGVQANGNIPGTGLGLAIAKEYVEQMEGKIELISPVFPLEKPSQGTAFIVWLQNV